ncbi:TatD family hydrolase [Polaribacter sp. KT 15]|uniref:TatD family hydrolase n=1 Tax=Polaribacter sp. KT 15 TaxID=1896175 RepID=UPI00090A3D5D|nr:TatD family hydrolase [Polaribacter sp. KT 15]SHM97356.1 TatD DNase family protein [Polaribacter sp. KT 15]
MNYFDAHTHTFSKEENVLSIVNKYPVSENFSHPFSIGIHPWFIKVKTLNTQFKVLEEKIQHKNCLAIGECGLDKLTEVDFQTQKEVFVKQIQLSEKYKKPLIIHCVKAHQEIIELKKTLKPKQVWVFHGFNKSLQLAESCLKNGIILSFGKAIINRNKIAEVFKKLPLNAILLETDNDDVTIFDVYKKASEIKNIEVTELQKQVEQNFKNIFI